MGFLRRKVPTHYIPIHAQNVSSKDWIILLEAGNDRRAFCRETPSRASHARENGRKTVQHISATAALPRSGRV